MEIPLVTVVIPCFNQGQYLQDAIDSVIASIYENIEIIIVNDGSTENSEVFELFDENEKIKILHQENMGVAAARNNAIAQANGEYILALDADDKIHPDYIKKAVEILETDNSLGLVYCEAEFFGDKSGKWNIQDYAFPEVLWTNMIFCIAMFRRADWETVGGYKSEMKSGFEDWEFWIGLIEQGLGVFRIPEAMYYYRQHSSSRSKVLSSKNDEINMIKQIIKLHPNLYADNIDKILLPMYRVFQYYSKSNTFASRLKYKIGVSLIKLLDKMSVIRES